MLAWVCTISCFPSCCYCATTVSLPLILTTVFHSPIPFRTWFRLWPMGVFDSPHCVHGLVQSLRDGSQSSLIVNRQNYAASPMLTKHLCWIVDSCRRRLVRIDELQPVDLNRQRRPDSIWNAELSIIGVCNPKDCELAITPSTASSLPHARLLCRLTAPSDNVLRAHFHRAIDNLTELMSGLHPAVASKAQVFVRTPTTLKLLLPHVPFIVSLHVVQLPTSH